MIRIYDVSKSLEDTEVLKHISMEFEEGKVYLLTGHNGCGKTMMLKLVCGLIQPSRGQVIRDRDYTYGFIIENPTFVESGTALEYLEFVRQLNNKVPEAEVERYLRIFGLYDRRNQQIKKYSWGMKQRLALCQAMMENPDVLVLDEPFNVLDSENYDEVLQVIREYKRKGKIIVIAVHGADDNLMSLVDSRILMENGAIKKISNTVMI